MSCPGKVLLVVACGPVAMVTITILPTISESDTSGLL